MPRVRMNDLDLIEDDFGDDYGVVDEDFDFLDDPYYDMINEPIDDDIDEGDGYGNDSDLYEDPYLDDYDFEF